MSHLKTYLAFVMLLSITSCQITKTPDKEPNETGDQLPRQPAPFKVTRENAKDFVKTALGFEMASSLGNYISTETSQNNALKSTGQNANQMDLQKITARMLDRQAPIEAYYDDAPKIVSKLATRATNDYEIGDPAKNPYFPHLAISYTNTCSVSGHVDISILDFNRDGKLSIAGEYGTEHYNNCNNGTSIIDGRFALKLRENIEKNNGGTYSKVNMNIEYNNFRIGNLNNVVTYNGHFQGKVINFNRRHLVYYISYSQNDFTIEDLSGGVFKLKGAFAIKSEWYDYNYNEDNLLTDISSPRLEDIATIDDIAAQVSFISASDNPTVEELRNSFKFSQQYTYTSSNLDNGTTEVKVISREPFEGKVGENPVIGKASIVMNGSDTTISVTHSDVTILSIIDGIGETLVYSWEDFKALLGSVTG